MAWSVNDSPPSNRIAIELLPKEVKGIRRTSTPSTI